MGFEPTTLCSLDKCSATELLGPCVLIIHKHVYMCMYMYYVCGCVGVADLKSGGVLKLCHLLHDNPLHHIDHQSHTVPSDEQ